MRCFGWAEETTNKKGTATLGCHTFMSVATQKDHSFTNVNDLVSFEVTIFTM